MAIMKRGKTWKSYLRYMGKDGKQHTKSKEGFKTKREAEYYESQLVIERQDFGLEPQSDVSFSNYFLTWFRANKELTVSSLTKSKYMTSYNSINQFFGATKIADVTETQYQSFLNNYAENHAKVSVQKLHIHAHQAIRKALRERLIKSDFAIEPTIGGGKSKQSSLKFLEAKDIEKLTDVVADSLTSMSTYMIYTAIFTGARLSEVAGLTWDNLDDKNNTITINKSWNYQSQNSFKPTKTESSMRTISIQPKLSKVLHTLILEQRVKAKTNPNQLIFANESGTPPTSNGVNKMLHKLMLKADIKKDGFTFHGLRHTHISYLLLHGVSIYYISQRAGHDNIATTMRVYSHILARLKKDEEKKTLEALSHL